MNRLIVVAALVSFVFVAAALGQSEDADVANTESATDSEDDEVTTADDEVITADDAEVDVDGGATSESQAVYSAADEVAQEQETQLTAAIGDLITYFTNAIADMSNILDDIRNVGESNSETTRANLVNNLMSYVEDTGMMRQQIGRVMQLRAQFQDMILEKLYSLPISGEDAQKLESDLREQIKLRADRVPGLQRLMQFHQNMHHRVSHFIPGRLNFQS